MRQRDFERSEIDMLGDSHKEWQSWCEAVGFVLRRITLRRFNTFRSFDPNSRQEAENIVVEFDILTGWVGHYVATGIWSFDPVPIQPVGDPVSAPVGFGEALSPQRIGTDLLLSEAKERLIQSVREAVRGRA